MLFFLSPETAFQAANTFAMLFWILLAVLPRWAYTRRIAVFGGVILLSLAYLSLASVLLSTSGDGMSLIGISKAFQTPQVALLGWVHYLAFDLFVGIWEVQDSQANNITHWIVLPCLFLTFMAGPIGLLLYFIIRTIRTKSIQV